MEKRRAFPRHERSLCGARNQREAGHRRRRDRRALHHPCQRTLPVARQALSSGGGSSRPEAWSSAGGAAGPHARFRLDPSETQPIVTPHCSALELVPTLARITAETARPGFRDTDTTILVEGVESLTCIATICSMSS